jgi:hypothetical protein
VKEIPVKNLAQPLSDSLAFRFMLIIGIVNLFGDTTDSGGASMHGLSLGSLGAGDAIVFLTCGVCDGGGMAWNEYG